MRIFKWRSTRIYHRFRSSSRKSSVQIRILFPYVFPLCPSFLSSSNLLCVLAHRPSSSAKCTFFLAHYGYSIRFRPTFLHSIPPIQSSTYITPSPYNIFTFCPPLSTPNKVSYDPAYANPHRLISDKLVVTASSVTSLLSFGISLDLSSSEYDLRSPFSR